MSIETTRRFRVALLGEGIGESLTPAMHMTEGEHLGLEYLYELFDISSETFDQAGLAAFIRGLQAAGFDGLNVTHPYKQRVIDLVDALSDEARAIGAVNLIVFGPDGAVGHNTDWTGFAASLIGQLDLDPEERVLQLGAGGAGAATVYALLRLGVRQVMVYDLDVARAQDLAARYAPLFGNQDVVGVGGDLGDQWASFTGVVHATPTGMDKHPGLPFDPDLLDPRAWIAEVVYRPLETELVRAARASGRTIVDGSQMAAGQAIDSLRILTGLEPDGDRVRAELVALLRQEAAATTGGPHE
jgi:shikimate dehydrogenase